MNRLFIDHGMTTELIRAQRLLALLDVLGDVNWRSTPELAARFGVSGRTIQRDLGALETLGYPLEVRQEEGFGNHPRYRLMKRSRSDAA